MKLTRNEQLETELIHQIDDSMRDDSRAQPSVTGMIYCLTKTYYENEMTIPNSDGQKVVKHTPEQVMLFITGLGLEKTILAGTQLSEGGDYNGIQWHTDHYGVDGRLYEVKSTRQSAKNSENLSEGWLKQTKSYCKIKGITEADIIILHLMGSYNPPFPTLICWHLEFTQQEIDENWEWIEARAETYKHYVELGEPPPPFKYNMDWECKFPCNWLGLCNARKTLSDNQVSRTI